LAIALEGVMERVAAMVVVAAMTAVALDAGVVVAAQFFSAFCVLWIWARQMASRYIRQGAALKMFHRQIAEALGVREQQVKAMAKSAGGSAIKCRSGTAADCAERTGFQLRTERY
jgi:hypothetical protein